MYKPQSLLVATLYLQEIKFEPSLNYMFSKHFNTCMVLVFSAKLNSPLKQQISELLSLKMSGHYTGSKNQQHI